MPSREILFNVDSFGVMVLYGLMLLPIGFLAYGLARRIRMWRRGTPENRFDAIGRRLWQVLCMVLFHGRIVRRRNLYGGVMHCMLFWGFIVLLIGTTLVMVEGDIAVPVLGRGFLHGDFYLGFKLAMNIAGLLLICGIAMALWRRFIMRPATQETTADDLLLLAFLLLLALQGFALQAFRLALTHDSWGAWSFVSYPMALALQQGSQHYIETLHRLTWWSHFATAFVFLGYAAYSKMIHPFTGLASMFLRRLKPRGALDPVKDMDTAATIGASRLEHFTWAQLMSLDACMHCGRCLEYCPTFHTGKALRPRDLVLQLAGLQADQGGVFSGVLGEAANSGRFRQGAGPDRTLIGGTVSEEEIWDCTTCGACMEQCPVYIEHVPFIVNMRRHLVMEQNNFPVELAPIFTSLERLGNPYQGIPLERAAWTRKLDEPVREMSQVAAKGELVEYLLFVGCLGSFAPRNVKTTIALARILQAAGVSFAILGKEETCNGDAARRMGHEYLADMLATKTVAKLNFYAVKKVITACAHCFNAIANEYPQLGGNYEVVHHSQLIDELITAGRLSVDGASAIAQSKVTYHDPCYLGRYNAIFEEPRRVISALPAAKLVEMQRNRRQSFCCGGGGGKAFMKDQGNIRINEERSREALNTDAEIVAAACPFCMGMLEDGIGAAGVASRVRVLDLAELVEASLQTSSHSVEASTAQ